LAHQLKGTVVFLGAQPAAAAVRQIEQTARSGDVTTTAAAIRELEHQVELLNDALPPLDTKPENAGRDSGNP
jgi:hypothetical protein